MPSLDRTLKPETLHTEKIIQFGEGNFLRAFADWMIDEMNRKIDYDGGVVVVQPIDKGLVDMLNEQNGLYTLYLKGIKDGEAVSESQVIGCINRAINPYQDFESYLKLAENPALSVILSNTTEAGIRYDDSNQKSDAPPASFPGKLTALLYHRYQFFKGDTEKSLLIIPCELIDRNGDKLKETILQMAENWGLEAGFTAWLEESIFANTLVDRIVPGYPKDRIGEIHEELGYEDKLVVEGEQFHLWVIEAPEKAKEIFPADKAGLQVLFTDNMAPYRTRKVRILNGAHTTMVPVGLLYGLETVRETVEHDVMGGFVKKAIFEEIIPTLDLPKEELEQFAGDVIDRFRNPYIKHFLASIALNSMSKYETRVLPSLLEFESRTGKLPARLVFALACLIHFYKGEYQGNALPVNDGEEVMAYFKGIWAEWDKSESGLVLLVEKALAYEHVWKRDLNQVSGLTKAVDKCLQAILEKGVQEVVKGLS